MKITSVNFLIKPTNTCNLNCKYCFNEGIKSKFLDFEDFKKLVVMLSKTYNKLQIVWHGGEPTLWGYENYVKAFNLLKSLESPTFTISQSIQSNCIHIDDKLLKLFLENNVKIGSSFDGPYNELTRGKTCEYLNTISNLNSQNIQVGAICVITNQTVKKLQEVYDYFKTNNQNLTLRPIIIDGNAEKYIQEFKLNIDEYIKELFLLYKTWIKDTDCNINIEPFTSLTKMTIGIPSKTCCYNSCIGNWFCLEPNGDITPCNRYFDNSFIYGNIKKINKVQSLFNSKGMKKLLKSSIKRRNFCKKHCEYFNLCNGGCNHEAFINGNIKRPDFPSCKILKELLPKIETLLKNETILNKKVIDILNQVR